MPYLRVGIETLRGVSLADVQNSDLGPGYLRMAPDYISNANDHLVLIPALLIFGPGYHGYSTG